MQVIPAEMPPSTQLLKGQDLSLLFQLVVLITACYLYGGAPKPSPNRFLPAAPRISAINLVQRLQSLFPQGSPHCHRGLKGPRNTFPWQLLIGKYSCSAVCKGEKLYNQGPAKKISHLWGWFMCWVSSWGKSDLDATWPELQEYPCLN